MYQKYNTVITGTSDVKSDQQLMWWSDKTCSICLSSAVEWKYKVPENRYTQVKYKFP